MQESYGKERVRCRKCLIKEMDKDKYFSNMYEYIAHLDEDIKAPSEMYEERLAICKSCDYLEEGMCRACGCFVELRAAVKKNVCSYSKW